MLLRFDPFREFDRLAEEVEQQLAGRSPAPSVPMDAVKVGDAVQIHFDLPGFDPSTIDLEVDHNVLTLKAERRWAPAEGQQVIANERRYGQFTRQLLLGDTLDGGNVQAAYRDGVLTVEIPVAETAKPRKVEIGRTDAPSTPLEVSETAADSGTTS